MDTERTYQIHEEPKKTTPVKGAIGMVGTLGEMIFEEILPEEVKPVYEAFKNDMSKEKETSEGRRRDHEMEQTRSELARIRVEIAQMRTTSDAI